MSRYHSELQLRRVPPIRVTTNAAVRLFVAFVVVLDFLVVMTTVGQGAIVLENGSSKVSNPPVEAGGHQLITPGRFHLSCFQNGAKITEGGALDHLGAAPSQVAGSLSFQIPETKGLSRIIPLGDGTTTCVVSPVDASPNP